MKFKYTVEPGLTRQAWRVMENGDLIAVCQNETNAVTMVGILNEHDTLKAQAELLEDMVAGLEIINPLITMDKAQFPRGTNFKMIDPKRIDKMISKAKGLR